jgi:hypothetical protein
MSTLTAAYPMSLCRSATVYSSDSAAALAATAGLQQCVIAMSIASQTCVHAHNNVNTQCVLDVSSHMITDY